MDPASVLGIVAGCTTLTVRCASVVQNLSSLVKTYKNAELFILTISEECETIQFAWQRIEQWASQNLQYVEDTEQLRDRLQRSIYSGELVMAALEEELVAILSRTNDIKRRAGLVWNNNVFLDHQNRIRGQVAALQLLLQVISMPRYQDRLEALSVKEKVFWDADESARSIIPSERSTLNSTKKNRLSIDSIASDLQYIRFSFEDALFTSHVYKRNYRFPFMNKLRQPKIQHIGRRDPNTQDSSGSRIDATESKELKGDANADLYEHSAHSDVTQLPEQVPADNVPQLSGNEGRNPHSFDNDNENDEAESPQIYDIIPAVALDIENQPTNIGHGHPSTPTSSMPVTPIVSILTGQAIIPTDSMETYQAIERDALKKNDGDKVMLSRGLQKATTAVLLDNAGNVEGAIEAYQDTMKCLQQVRPLDTDVTDSRKLDTIRMAYAQRIKELQSEIKRRVEELIDLKN
ncbi:hypothetical protein K505DRAFT_414740 [Melanomma pulvis-pyrius CBS 109.77]|uniref:MIT domain-containing protein n=1 Tax=Melanomma pulvis-pyrius CBS 109.77 TaxID=1314802 RepID=A0A6A6XQS1_9PLEO|nr:hypothetical protein K505DRAFT_414740 [Melanomma pulvis-pyrius CBS 109.77]